MAVRGCGKQLHSASVGVTQGCHINATQRLFITGAFFFPPLQVSVGANPCGRLELVRNGSWLACSLPPG